MITQLGKELRKLRIDVNERLTDMARRLAKSPAFISAVELGKKAPPAGLEELVIKSYGLAGETAENLKRAADACRRSFTLQPDSALGRDTAGLLARRMNSLSETQLEQIQAILKKGANG
jgi:hypothetical protein